MGEWGVIAALTGRMPAGPLTSVGIGDDAAVIGAPSGSVVAAVDLLLEGRHFRRDWSSAYDIGVKAAARSLADIAAMGAVNTALLVALAVPGALAASWPLELADGLAAEAARAGAGIVGGDTARADSVLLSVTALGDLAGRRPVLRSGAGPGDVIAVAGPLGRSAAGLALLSAGVAGERADVGGAGRADRRPPAPVAALRGGPGGGDARRDRDDRRERRTAGRPRPHRRRERRRARYRQLFAGHRRAAQRGGGFPAQPKIRFIPNGPG